MAGPGKTGRRKRALSARRSLIEMIEALGKERTEENLTRREATARQLWQMAVGGDLAAIKLLLAYLVGLPLPRQPASDQAAADLVTGDDMNEAARQMGLWESGEWANDEPDRRAKGTERTG